MEMLKLYHINAFLAIYFVASVSGAVSDTDCVNDQCPNIDNTECDDQSSPKCKCLDGYHENDNTCVKILGVECTSTSDCTGVDNSDCIDNKCTCNTDYGEKNDVCVKTVSGITCTENGNECDDIENSACDTAADKMTCMCNAGYVMNVDECTAENAAASCQFGIITALVSGVTIALQLFW